MKQAPGFYARRVFPWLNEKLGSDPELVRIRAEALASARGKVIEIGFGSGLNLPHYPDAVTALVAIEPNEGMQARAEPRVKAARFPVDIVRSDAESLALPDRSFDTAVSVLTLCSVTSPALVLAELRRVLRDNGQLIVLEHGLAEDPSVVRWQNRLNGVQKIFACGCHLNRPIAELVRANGFQFDALRKFFVPKKPRTQGWITIGTARKA